MNYGSDPSSDTSDESSLISHLNESTAGPHVPHYFGRAV